MPVDASPYAGMVQANPNPLAKMGPADILNLANEANKLSLFPLQKRQMEAQTQGAEFDTASKGYGFALNGISALAAKPDVSRKDAIDFITSLSRQPGMANVPTKQFIDEINRLPDDKKGIKNWIATKQGQFMGTSGTEAQAIGIDQSTGQPIVGTRGQANRRAMGLDQPSPQGYVTSLPTGAAERMKGGAEVDNQLAASLSHEAEGSQQRRALLGNVMDLADKFEPGPGAAESKTVKAFINRNIPLPEGWKFDKGSIASQEEFAKQAAQFAQKQFDTIGGTGTDAKFNSAFTVSPNEALSKMGIKGISRMLLGNEDAIQAKNKAWLDASTENPNTSYRVFSKDFNSHFDPRVFQFKYVPAKERQEYFDKLEPQDQSRLLHDMTFARKQGWVRY